MVVSITTNNNGMEGTLWVLQPPSVVIMDMTWKDLVQGLARHQEIGTYQLQHATNVILHTILIFTCKNPTNVLLLELTRRYVKNQWILVFQLMTAYHEIQGNENEHLCVWFINICLNLTMLCELMCGITICFLYFMFKNDCLRILLIEFIWQLILKHPNLLVQYYSYYRRRRLFLTCDYS